jgi:hypothetical protein
VEQRQAQQRPDDAPADYEYDEAHDRSAHEAPVHVPQVRPAQAPEGRWEADGDMGYDEAHGF